MSYVRHVLQPGEILIFEGRRHWIGYWRAGICTALALALVLISAPDSGTAAALRIGAAALLVLALVFALEVAFRRWTTEIGVTNRRVIYKRGFISRYTAEMNMDKIETVLVRQSLLGRILNYGTITIQGTGASIETLSQIADPIALRSSITAH